MYFLVLMPLVSPEFHLSPRFSVEFYFGRKNALNDFNWQKVKVQGTNKFIHSECQAYLRNPWF